MSSRRYTPSSSDHSSYNSDHSVYSDDFSKSSGDSDGSDYSRNRSQKKTPSPKPEKASVTKAENYNRNRTLKSNNSTRPQKKSAPASTKRMYGGSSSYNNSRNNTRPRNFSNNTPRKQNAVQQRLMSAKRNKVNQLNNEINILNKKVEDLLKENKLLKTLQHRQGKALKKLEDTESELPRLIRSHMEEQRVMKARVRKSQAREREIEVRLRKADDNTEKLENQLNKYKRLARDQNLLERNELSRELEDTHHRLAQVERRNQDLVRNLELNSQSFMRQLRDEHRKLVQTKTELENKTDECNALTNKIKEKDRQLEVSNIYSLRSQNRSNTSFNSSIATNQSLVIKSPRPHKTSSPRKPPTKKSPRKNTEVTLRRSFNEKSSEELLGPVKSSGSPIPVLAPLTPTPPPPVAKIHLSKDLQKSADEELLLSELNEENKTNASKEKLPPTFYTENSALSNLSNPPNLFEANDLVTNQVRSSAESASIKIEEPTLKLNLSNDSIKQESSFNKISEDIQLSESARNKKEAEDRKKAMLLAKMRKIDEQENQLTPRSDVMKATTSSYKAAASQSNIQHTALRSNSKSPHNEVASKKKSGAFYDDDLAFMFGFSLALRQNSQSSPKTETSRNRELISHSRKQNSNLKEEISQKKQTEQ